MPPIKVYTQSPINAAKASGVTPQTAAPADSGTNKTLPYTPAHTTAAPTPTRTVPLHQDGPPPPQPGAVPRLPEATATATATASSSTLPPPPRAGASAVAGASASPPAPTPAPTAAPHLPAAVPYPPQMGIPPPQTGLNQRGTSTTLSPSAAPSAWDGSSQAGSGGGGYPGYQQNVSAAGGYAAPSPYQSGGGGGGGGFGQDGDGGEEEGVWGTAVKFAKAAGKRLSEAESEVWKRINGEGSR